MAKYTIIIPQGGWVREKIDSSADWQGNLASPTTVVELDLCADRKLVVTLEEARTGVEILEAEMWKWDADDDAPNGGYWVPGWLVSAADIALV